MAINPLLVSIKQASDLTTVIPTNDGFFFYYEDGDLRKASMTDIYNKVNGAFGGKLMIADVPAPTVPTWFYAGESGTYTNAGGLVVDTTGKVVILSYDGTAWSMIETAAVEGKSAYQVALDNGFVGTEAEWNESIIRRLEFERLLVDSTIGTPILIGDFTYNIPFGYLASDVIYFEKLDFSEKKYVHSIEMYAQSAGTINIVFGLIDQNGFIIPRITKSLPTTAGVVNTYVINEVILEGEAWGVLCPGNGLAWQTMPAGTGTMYEQGNGAVNLLDYRLAGELSISDYYENPLVTKSAFNALENRITTLEQKPISVTSPNGTPYSISVTNAGVLTAKSLLFGKIAHLGNSIGIHPITSYWWGEWGMAATTREQDYVHQLLSKYQTINPAATTNAMNIAGWETNHTGFDKTTIDTTIAGADLIVVRVGENAGWSASYKGEFRELIEYIQTEVPTATILIGGTFWYEANKDADMQDIAIEKGITFVSMQGLDIPANRSSMGAQVYGDDLAFHTVDNQGVANHPGDLGMEAIAQRLFNGLGF